MHFVQGLRRACTLEQPFHSRLESKPYDTPSRMRGPPLKFAVGFRDKTAKTVECSHVRPTITRSAVARKRHPLRRAVGRRLTPPPTRLLSQTATARSAHWRYTPSTGGP